MQPVGCVELSETRHFSEGAYDVEGRCSKGGRLFPEQRRQQRLSRDVQVLSYVFGDSILDPAAPQVQSGNERHPEWPL